MIYKKKLLNTLLIGYGGLMLLLIGMLTGSMLLSSDVLFMNSPLMDVFDILITVVDIFAYAISAAILIYGIYLIGAKGLTDLYAAYLCITVFHYVALLCIGWLIFPGKLPQTVQDLIRYMVEDVLLFVALDCIRMLVIGFVTAKVLVKREAQRKDQNRKANILGHQTMNARSVAFPFASFISFKSPLQIGIFTTSFIYWLTFYFQYVYIDILSLIKFDYVEGFGMQVIYLLLNAALACICYCIMMFILIKLDEKLPNTNE